ncbi:hypothetical protein T08_15141 [Trichinella sp. T8]|nr:hypothetical protein T08_15141 [Trichinella sp. T8]
MGFKGASLLFKGLFRAVYCLHVLHHTWISLLIPDLPHQLILSSTPRLGQASHAA